MSREIKFRVWENNRFLYFSLRDLLAARTTVGHGYDKFPWNEDSPVQQFTGLLDINNKEIYEGDIISDETGVDYVYFRDGCFWVDDQWLYDHAGNNKIIGNIFENLELCQ